MNKKSRLLLPLSHTGRASSGFEALALACTRSTIDSVTVELKAALGCLI